jgi:trans-aconitate methyltransferase
MSSVSTLINRAARLIMPARSKERYFSAVKWDDSWSRGYESTMNSAQEDARYGSLIALMRRYEREGPVLDVGCGDGLLEEWYRKISDAPVVAFDYSQAAIERARARNLRGVEFLCADSRTFQPKERFSAAVLNESLYYVDDYLGLLERLSGALASDGVFVISMHDTRITRRIWRNVQRVYTAVHGITLEHEPGGGLWRIRVFRPPKGGAA